MKSFIAASLLLGFTFGGNVTAQPSLEKRIEGLLFGSLIGDAAGGPVEFVETDWYSDSLLTQPLSGETKTALAERFHLRDYPKKAEPYAQWIDYAPAGTITDDSRYKLLLLQSVKEKGALSRKGFLEYLIAYHDTPGAFNDSLKIAWLEEYMYRYRWLAGNRKPSEAYPPERVWGGIATMAGQMPYLPVAAFYPGNPEEAYKKTWQLNLLDVGYGKDFTSALAAGLSQALVAEPGDWNTVLETMRATDPYAFAEVPWVPRRFTMWMDRASGYVEENQPGIPAELFEKLEKGLRSVTWWEARVPPVLTFAILEATDYDPLASMELALAFGRDTDSTAQLMGAFLGAMYGAEAFPEEIRAEIDKKLGAQYDISVEKMVKIILDHQ